MEIIDAIGRCNDGNAHAVNPSDVRSVAIHRAGKDLKYGIDLGDTGPEVSDHFTGRNTQYPEITKATGGENAYGFAIGTDLCGPENDGLIWQILPLFDQGAHARRWNDEAIGVVVLGDPRVKPLSPKAYQSLTALLVLLCGSLAVDCSPIARGRLTDAPGLRGHDEMKGGSKDPAKRCPGDLLDMHRLRLDVEGLITARWQSSLIDAGIVT